MRIAIVIRDLKSRFRESLFIVLAMMLGVISVSSVYHYSESLRESLQTESVTGMGANLAIESSVRAEPDKMAEIRSLFPKNSHFAEVVNFSSMIYSPQNSKSSLVSVKGRDDSYPFYGNIVTNPPKIAGKLSSGEMIMDKNLAQRLGLSLGARVMLGEKTFKIAAFLESDPAGVSNFVAFAPVVIISRKDIEATGLEKKGSRIQYYIYIKLPENSNAALLKEKLFHILVKDNLQLYHSSEFYSGARRLTGTTMAYLSILGLAALFLGSISVLLATKSVIHARLGEIAVLKCLGAKNRQILLFVFAEFLVLSLTAIILGNLVSAIIVKNTNLFSIGLFSGFVPGFHWQGVWRSVLPGAGIPLLVVMDSVWYILRIRPALALQERDSDIIRKRNPFVWILLLLFIHLMIYLEMKIWYDSLVLTLLFVLIPLLLYLFYYFSASFARRIFSAAAMTGWPRLLYIKFVHPESVHTYTVTGISSALFILGVTLFVHKSVLNAGGAGIEKRPNMFVLDIRREQLAGFDKVAGDFGAELKRNAPVTGARLVKINGEPVNRSVPVNAMDRNWRSTAKIREYYLSYRKKMYETEEIVDGRFWEEGEENMISVEYEFAEYLGANVGDTLEFNVQGIPVTGRILNKRTVKWNDMRPNFVVLFSGGILEKAPAYYISSFHVTSEEARSRLQDSLAEKYPNLTVIDTENSVKAFSGLMNRVFGMVEFLAFMVLLSGLLLMAISMYSSRGQRKAETAVYRITGARTGFIRNILLSEALLIPVISGISGLIPAWAAAEYINRQILNIFTDYPFTQILWLLSGILVINVFINYMDSRYWTRRPAGRLLQDIKGKL